MLIGMAYRFKNGRLVKVRDSSGHEHDSRTGQFTSGGSSSSSSESSDSKPKPKPSRGILARAADAAKKAGEILKSGVKVPAAALKAAKKLVAKAMGAIEKRYGSKIKKAVGIAVLVSLPLPVPGMSVVLSAPILAFAELHKQLTGKSDEQEPKPKLIKGLTRKVIRQIFGGRIPRQVDFDALNQLDADEPEKAATVIVKDQQTPEMLYKDSLGVAPVKDAKRMHMRFLVSTPTVDRDYEIVMPSGRVGDSYQKANGPWFFNHQQFPYAIGSTKERPKDPDCPLDIQVADEGIVQGCFFNQATKEAEILYRLYDDGDMSATSIGFHGLTSSRIDGEEAAKMGAPYGIRRWDKWEHVETSLVGVGANRHALTMHIHRGAVGKLTLPETLKAAFSPFLLPATIWSNGAKFPQPDQQSSLRQPTTEAKAMADTPNGTGDPKKPTHDALETYAKGIHAVLEAMAPKLAMSELDEIKGDLMRACKGAWESAADLVDMHGSEYKLTMPELPEGISFDGIEDKDGDDEEKPKPAEPETESDDDEELDEEEEKALTELVEKLSTQIDQQEKILATA